MQLAVRTAAVSVPVRLDELGRTPLVTFSYRTIPGNRPKPPMERIASAIPTWDEQTSRDAIELGWDEFWARHPEGASRITPLGSASFADAVKAARALSLTTRPGMAPGDKQAQAVLQLADGSFHAASLGGVGTYSAWLLRMGSYPGYWRPRATALVPELVAVVGGASHVDLRGKLGTPVQT